jgi:hypothetical protein
MAFRGRGRMLGDVMDLLYIRLICVASFSGWDGWVAFDTICSFPIYVGKRREIPLCDTPHMIIVLFSFMPMYGQEVLGILTIYK